MFLDISDSIFLLLSIAIINFVCTEERAKNRDRKWSGPSNQLTLQRILRLNPDSTGRNRNTQ